MSSLSRRQGSSQGSPESKTSRMYREDVDTRDLFGIGSAVVEAKKSHDLPAHLKSGEPGKPVVSIFSPSQRPEYLGADECKS